MARLGRIVSIALITAGMVVLADVGITLAYREQFANPFRAAELGFVDEVIRPRELRKRLVECLRRLRNKKDEGPKRKHGNIPL